MPLFSRSKKNSIQTVTDSSKVELSKPHSKSEEVEANGASGTLTLQGSVSKSNKGQALWNKFKNGLKSLVPNVVPSWLVREYMAIVNWSSQHLWEVSMEGLSGYFKAYCPMSQITFSLGAVTTGSLTVGNYSFSYPVGTETKTCKAIFHDDAYCTLSIAMAERMQEIHGFGQQGVEPYATAGRKLCFRSLTRGRIEVTRVNMLVVPINSVDITGTQSPAVREVEVTFLVQGLEILSCGKIAGWLDRIDLFNLSSYVQTGTFGDVFGTFTS